MLGRVLEAIFNGHAATEVIQYLSIAKISLSVVASFEKSTPPMLRPMFGS
jgi:hypothetical protein